MNTKLNILIVEDKTENIAAAKKQLSEHNLIIVTGFDDALTALKRNHYVRSGREVAAPEKFDAVLTDCMFPKGGDACMGPNACYDEGEQMPYGPMVVLHAIAAGVQHIGLVTQGNHHDDPFVFALDGLHGFKSEKVSLVVGNEFGRLVYRDTGDDVPFGSDDRKNWWDLKEKLVWVKDWQQLLERALGVYAHPDKDKFWFEDRHAQVRI